MKVKDPTSAQYSTASNWQEAGSDVTGFVPITATDGTNTVTVTNDGTKFEVYNTYSDGTKDELILKQGESALFLQDDTIGSETVFYGLPDDGTGTEGLACIERKKYNSDGNPAHFRSQQLYLQDGLTRPQYDLKTNESGSIVNNVHNIAFLDDISSAIITIDYPTQTDDSFSLNGAAATISLADVAKTGAYADLSGRPTIPTVNDATLTLQKSGSTLATFTANSATAVVFDVTETDPTVPTWAKTATKPTYTKSEVGLGNVDNTSDANKPVSTAQQTALDAKYSKITAATGNLVVFGTNGTVLADSGYDPSDFATAA